jgi:hypothetical protein
VFVGHDSEALYVAFNCEEPNPGGRRVSKSSFVEYDGLWPTGEDLVEVLIDPTGQAIGPEDLIHIVVKANGAAIAERGVACLKRVAPHDPIPVNLQAAVDDRSQPGRWMVELRIPYDLIDGDSAPVWGINFARYDAQRGEYASWTASPSHLYSPVFLGNMRFAD